MSERNERAKRAFVAVASVVAATTDTMCSTAAKADHNRTYDVGQTCVHRHDLIAAATTKATVIRARYLPEGSLNTCSFGILTINVFDLQFHIENS